VAKVFYPPNPSPLPLPHVRFIESGYGGVDRYERNISLKRFEVYVNGESRVISDRFSERAGVSLLL
jgi:hypothetical protein